MKYIPMLLASLALLGCVGSPADQSAGAAATRYPLSSVGGGLRDSTDLVCEAASDPSDGFGRIGLVASGDSGRLAWADPVSGQVMLRRGDGPLQVAGNTPGTGSFALTGALGWRGDTLWVSDARTQMVQYLVAGPRLLRSDTMSGDAGLWVPRPGGRFVGFTTRTPTSREWAVVAATVRGRLDTIARLPFSSPQVLRLAVADGEDTLEINHPLAPQTLVARNDDGSRWCSASPVSADEERVFCADDHGGTALDTTLTLQPREVPRETYDSLISDLVTRRGVDLMVVLQAFSSQSPLPLVNGIRVDLSGDLWLALTHPTQPVTEWLRVRRDGMVRDTVMLPSRLIPRGLAGDTIWAVDSTGRYRQPTVMRCLLH